MARPARRIFVFAKTEGGGQPPYHLHVPPFVPFFATLKRPHVEAPRLLAHVEAPQNLRLIMRSGGPDLLVTPLLLLVLLVLLFLLVRLLVLILVFVLCLAASFSLSAFSQQIS